MTPPLSSVRSVISTPDNWPAPPDPAVYHGLAGRIVRTIEPHSEADPIALLSQLLVVFGTLVGRGPHFTVEADNHYTNLFVNLIGPTSKGRKGSAYGHADRFAQSVDPAWSDRVESGLTSGEGLIYAVRDPEGDEDDKDADEGVRDKRLLVFESEFANVLRVLERQGNRLSSVVRDAWDGRTLRTLTRNTRAKATGAHISIIGHITADELQRYLDKTEIANGFGNRFLWLCVRRSKSLPDGGRMHTVNVAPLVAELDKAVRFARTVQKVDKDNDASERWRNVYGDLSEGLPGLVGALTGRAEAQVLRIAHVYALLDCSAEIQIPHLEAALALWDYSLRSVQHVFGTSLGDPLADTILNSLRERHGSGVNVGNGAKVAGLSRTDIRAIVGGRVSADQISRALSLLERYRLAYPVNEHTGGRPSENWFYGTSQRPIPNDDSALLAWLDELKPDEEDVQ
jgi:hypothetical protein